VDNGPQVNEQVFIMLKGIEKVLEGYDDRFDVQGEFLLRLSDEDIVEILRVLFAWALKDKEDVTSIKDMVLVLEGEPKEVAKVLALKGKDLPTDVSSGPIAIVLSMHKGLVEEIVEKAQAQEDLDMSNLLVGSDRSTKVFDFTYYDIISIVTD